MIIARPIRWASYTLIHMFCLKILAFAASVALVVAACGDGVKTSDEEVLVSANSTKLSSELDNRDETPDEASTTSPEPEEESAKSVSTELASRIYPGWCQVAVLAISSPPPDASISGTSIQEAVDFLGVDGGVLEISGRFVISEPISMRPDVVLQGDGSAVIETEPGVELSSMIEFSGGGYVESSGRVVEGRAFTDQMVTSQSLSPGYYLIGSNDDNGGQLVEVTSSDGNIANLAYALTQDFDGYEIFANPNGPHIGGGVRDVTLIPKGPVNDLIALNRTVNTSVENVTTEGEGGQIRSAILLSQAYSSEIIGNELVEANQFGDGGRGYGISIANNSSNNLIADNEISRMRHSMLLHVGAAGNVVSGNSSTDAIHPNFQNGGPADMSFHGYASSNLVINNTLLRTHISDAGKPGPNNMIAFNTFTSGPLTIANGANNLTVLNNTFDGSFSELTSNASAMQVIDSSRSNPALSKPRKLWSSDYDPFAGPDSTDRRLQRGVGILDLDSGSADDIYVDQNIEPFDFCS